MAKYVVDKSHSNIGFEVKHMMVSKVKGTFDDFEAVIEADNEDLTTANISFEIKAASINTRNEERDNHLRSADFFDVENFETISFKATEIVQTDDNEYDLIGDLTIKDVTKQVKFEIEYNGKGVNPWGVEVHGFEGEAKINREDFGLTWNAALETGGFLVGKDIKIKLELEVNPAAQ